MIDESHDPGSRFTCKHALGLDSGCVWGGKLTLARLKRHGRFAIVAQVKG